MNILKMKFMRFLGFKTKPKAPWKKYYTKDEIIKLNEIINNIPDTNRLLHGDLHTGNILVDENDNLYLIDFAELGIGHPIFDIMAQGAVIPITVENDHDLAETYHGTSTYILDKIWCSYLMNYFDTKEISKLQKHLTTEFEMKNLGGLK